MEASQALEPIQSEEIQLTDAEKLKLLRQQTRAKAIELFHGPGMARLGHMLENGDDKVALGAIQTVGRISGDLRAGPSVEVKLSFEQLRQQQQPEPLAGLFEIQGTVVEGTLEEEEALDSTDSDTN